MEAKYGKYWITSVTAFWPSDLTWREGEDLPPLDAAVLLRMMWGELAWQLGGPAAYARIQADDERATSPGDVLRELFRQYGPCLVLIDEWVAYARRLHDHGDASSGASASLPGGGFETQFTFAQVLTESAKLVDTCLLVIRRYEKTSVLCGYQASSRVCPPLSDCMKMRTHTIGTAPTQQAMNTHQHVSKPDSATGPPTGRKRLARNGLAIGGLPNYIRKT